MIWFFFFMSLVASYFLGAFVQHASDAAEAPEWKAIVDKYEQDVAELRGELKRLRGELLERAEKAGGAE